MGDKEYRLVGASKSRSYIVGRFDGERICENATCDLHGKSFPGLVCPRCKSAPVHLPEVDKCALPILMHREVARVAQEIPEDNAEQNEDDGSKKRRGRRKPNLTPDWVLQDSEGANKYVGSLEGGQAASYVALALEDDGTFRVVPVRQWFRFKKPIAYKTLSLEEAEEITKTNQLQVERWLMQRRLAGQEGKVENSDLAEPSRIRTGALLTKVQNKEDDTSIFAEVDVAKKRNALSAARRGRASAGSAVGEDGADLEAKMSDDESDSEITNEGPVILHSDSDEELDDNLDSSLSHSGQEMKDLLKREDQRENKAEEEEPQSDSDEEFTVKDMAKYEKGPGHIKRDLGGNIISVKNTQNMPEEPSLRANGPMESRKRAIGEINGSASAVPTKLQRQEAPAERPGAAPGGAVGGGVSASGGKPQVPDGLPSGVSGSRSAPALVAGPSKAAKPSSRANGGVGASTVSVSGASVVSASTGAAAASGSASSSSFVSSSTSVGATAPSTFSTSSTSSSSSVVARLSEAAVRDELLRYGGKMKTKELLKKFKRLLKTEADRNLFKDILKHITRVVEDPLEGRILMLKDAFK